MCKFTVGTKVKSQVTLEDKSHTHSSLNAAVGQNREAAGIVVNHRPIHFSNFVRSFALAASSSAGIPYAADGSFWLPGR